jgi:hypothetical protein
MITELQKTSVVWCLKRCCWLHIIYKRYQNITCTSANQLGKAKYNIHLIVKDVIDNSSNSTVVYDEPKLHNHNHTNDFNLIRKTKEDPIVLTTDAK